MIRLRWGHEGEVVVIGLLPLKGETPLPPYPLTPTWPSPPTMCGHITTSRSLSTNQGLTPGCFGCLVAKLSFPTPWTVACQAPLSMGFPRQEYWSGLPFPPPGDLSDPGIKTLSPALAGIFLPLSYQGTGTKSTSTLILNSQSPEWQKINAYCLHYPVCGIVIASRAKTPNALKLVPYLNPVLKIEAEWNSTNVWRNCPQGSQLYVNSSRSWVLLLWRKD